MFPGYFMATLDLKDAYFLVPVDPRDRKFLRFSFKGRLYQFTCLPFGLCICPYIFTKIMKPVVRRLRSRGLASTLYIDDWFLIAETREACLYNIQVTVQLLEFLGFVINYKKSQLTPEYRCKFLGFLLDSSQMRIELTVEKREKISKMTTSLLNKKCCKILDLSRVIGTLVAACPGSEYGHAHVKSLEKAKIDMLRQWDNNFEAIAVLPGSIRADLIWWKKKIGCMYNNIKTNQFEKVIFTDASKVGWGATDGKNEIKGLWNTDQSKFHINYLELFCVKIALETLAGECRDCQILLRVDNTTALAYVNKMGGVRYPKYNHLAKEIWNWAENRNIFLMASYIASSENKVADRLSRENNIDTEWCLADYAFREITRVLGTPEVDLFASDQNAKCKKFVSWHRSDKACQIDAFTINWAKMKFYAFPPFSQILRTLAKIKRDKAEGIVVVPKWENQPWFPLFLELLEGETIEFEPNENLLSVDRQKHPRARNLSLIAGKLSASLL